MEGHYHADFGDDDESDEETPEQIVINEPDIHKFAAELVVTQQRLKRKPIRIGFCCTFGCGHLHQLTQKDRLVLVEAIKKYKADAPANTINVQEPAQVTLCRGLLQSLAALERHDPGTADAIRRECEDAIKEVNR